MFIKSIIKKIPYINDLIQVHRRIQAEKAKKEFDQGFKREFESFVTFSKNSNPRFEINWEDTKPILERTQNTNFDRHYIYHTAWAARCLHKIKPEKHIDISSSLFFNVIASAFVPIDFYDYRPADICLDNFKSLKADLINLPFQTNSIHSLSCMHTVEHIGLGRYGDPLDPEGDLKAINELKRILAPNGNLLFVVPLGKPKIYFNAQRKYSAQQVLDYFEELDLVELSVLPDDDPRNGFRVNPSNEWLNKKIDSCGCFWFKKSLKQP